MAHWKKSRGFPLQKVTLKLAFTGKIIGSHCREPVEELLRKAHSGVEGFPTVLHMLFYSQQDALALKLPVMQLQLIFNSSTKKNRMCKRTFVCSLGKGRQCCAASLGRKGKCCCPPATQKLQGTHLLWQDDLHNATCAHWIKGKFSLIVWFRSISRLSKLKRKICKHNTSKQNLFWIYFSNRGSHFGWIFHFKVSNSCIFLPKLFVSAWSTKYRITKELQLLLHSCLIEQSSLYYGERKTKLVKKISFVCHKIYIYEIHFYKGFLKPRITHLWRPLSCQNIVGHMDFRTSDVRTRPHPLCYLSYIPLLKIF